MKHEILGLSLLAAMLCAVSCRSLIPVDDQQPRLPRKTIDMLTKRAQSGDAKAAFDLSRQYAVSGDSRHEEHWLMIAARSLLPDAQTELAALIDARPTFRDFGEWGPSRQEAVMALLKAAAPASGEACWLLANRFDRGYFGKSGTTNAVYFYRQAADKGAWLAWERLARHLAEDRGTNTAEEAYYWCSLTTRFVHPDSGTGREMWDLRQRLTERLTPTDMACIWMTVDAETTAIRTGKKTIDPEPCSGTGGTDEEGIRQHTYAVADEREAKYRQSVVQRQQAGPVGRQ